MTPPAALTPYNRGAGTVRQVRSQRETDLSALDLAARKGALLGELRALIAGGKLDDAGVMKAEWFADQVRGARSGSRLDDLTALFSEAGPRPRHWWQPRPELGGTLGAEDDGDDDYDDPGDPGDAGRGAEVAPAARAGGMSWGDALAACGWRLATASGGCQVIDEQGRHCKVETSGPAIPDGRGGYAWACGPHYGTLGAVIGSARRQAQEGAA